MNIKVYKEHENASCNACGARNYDMRSQTDTERVDAIYAVKIGCMGNQLCKGCMTCLVGAIALEIDLLNAE